MTVTVTVTVIVIMIMIVIVSDSDGDSDGDSDSNDNNMFCNVYFFLSKFHIILFFRLQKFQIIETNELDQISDIFTSVDLRSLFDTYMIPFFKK